MMKGKTGFPWFFSPIFWYLRKIIKWFTQGWVSVNAIFPICSPIWFLAWFGTASHSSWVHQEITINLSGGAEGHPTSPSSQKLLLSLGTLPSAVWSLKLEMTNLQGHLSFFLFQVFTLGTLNTFLLNAHQLAWFSWARFPWVFLLCSFHPLEFLVNRILKVGGSEFSFLQWNRMTLGP